MDDNLKSNSRANKLIDGEHTVFINETSFLPSLELINRFNDKKVGEAIGNNTELQKYIEVALIIENRNINHDISGECKSNCDEL